MTENQKRWQRRISEQRSSSLTQTEWCRQNEINLNTFRYWCKRLKKLENTDVRNTAFVALQPAKVPVGNAIHIRVGSAEIEVGHETDMELLSDVVRVLMHHA